MSAAVQVPVTVRVDSSVLAGRPGDVDRALRAAAARALTSSRESLHEHYGANLAVHLFPPEFTWTGPAAGGIGTDRRAELEMRLSIGLIAAATAAGLLDSAVPPGAPDVGTGPAAKKTGGGAAKGPGGAAPGGDEPSTEGDTVADTIKLIFTHPRGGPEDDRVVEGTTEFEGRLVAILPRWAAVRVQSQRYAISTDIRRAVRWGLLLFGARSWVIIEGPMGTPQQRYIVVGTNAAITLPKGEAGTGTRLPTGDEVWGIAGIRHWEVATYDLQHRLYLYRALFSADGDPLFATEPLAREFFGEIAQADPATGAITAAAARPLVFGDIDRLIRTGEVQAAANRLAELDAEAFRIVGWETKVSYLKTLIQAWTLARHEKAIVEVIKSVQTRTELDAVVELLKDGKIFLQLFDDLGTGELFSLLKTVGRQIDPTPVTLSWLLDFAQSAGLVPGQPRDLAKLLLPGPAGLSLNEDFVREMYQAASALVSTLAGVFEGLWMLVSEPAKVVDAVGQLFKLAVMMELARWGHEESQRTLMAMLRNMAQDAVHAMKGAQVLGMGEDVVRRMKWTIIWEIASLFVGVGEVAAVIKGIGLGERLVVLSALLRALGVLGKASEAEQIAVRAERFARAIRATSTLIRADEEAVRLLAHLPPDDLARISRLLEQHDISAAVLTVQDLARIHSELGSAAQDALRKIEILHRLEAKAGGASDLVVGAFQHLADGRRGLSAAQVERIVAAIPEGEGLRFARAMRAIPESEIASGRMTGEMLEVLAASQRRMDTVIDAGYPTYSAVARRAGGNGTLLDEYLDALVDLELQYAATERRADLRRLLDGIERGEPAAWETLEDARRARLGIDTETRLNPDDVASWIDDELARLEPSEAPGPLLPPPGPVPAAPALPPRPIVKRLQDVDLSDLSAADRAAYTQRWASYKGPLRTLDQYIRFRHGARTGQLQRGTAFGRLGEAGVVEQLAGPVLERVVNTRLPGAANSQAFPTRWGNVVPDHVPPGQRLRHLGPDGNVKPDGTPFSARFIGDSKYRADGVPLNDQTRGFIELAARSDEEMMVFYVRWQDNFPAANTLTNNPMLGGLELPVRWNQEVVAPGLLDLARARRVRVRIVSDPLWR